MKRRIGGAGGGSDPGSGGPTRIFVAAAATAVAVAAGGTTTGTFSAISGTGADIASTQSISTFHKAQSRRAARNGKPDKAWRSLGMRRLKKAKRENSKCAANSFDQIREFFDYTPCTSLQRVLLAVGDESAGTVVISISWVRFRDQGDARRFKQLIDVHGNGDVRPLATALLGMADIRFTGLHYQSDRRGHTVVIAETESVDERIDEEVLEAVADVAVLLPSP